jgi:hypothetical protein
MTIGMNQTGGSAQPSQADRAAAQRTGQPQHHGLWQQVGEPAPPAVFVHRLQASIYARAPSIALP